ncbi:MAG: PBP1A family penicillin-binding protein [Bacillota bacterium]|jgi:penicillin-binding protein 1A
MSSKNNNPRDSKEYNFSPKNDSMSSRKPAVNKANKDDFSNRPYSAKRNLSLNRNFSAAHKDHLSGRNTVPKKGPFPNDSRSNRISADKSMSKEEDIDIIQAFYNERNARKSHRTSTTSSNRTISARSNYQSRGTVATSRGSGSSGRGRNTGSGGRPPKNKGPRKRKGFNTFLKIIGIAILVIAISLGIWTLVLAKDLPEVTPELLMNEQASLVYDKEGEVYSNLHSGENRISVPLDEMPDYLIDCFISTEDARFYNHNGVDVIRIFGALKTDILKGRLAEGASTITMQLARNAILEDQSKQLTRKIKEALLALKIEDVFSKDEILYYYLNEIYFGPGANGIQLGAKLYFNKDVSELTLGEAAMLTGIVRNVKIYSPFNDIEKATNVRNTVLDNLARYKPEYQAQVDEAKAEELVVAEKRKISTAYAHPWFTDYVIDQAEEILKDQGIDSYTIYNGGLHIYTTLDVKVQEAMEDVYEDSSYFPSSNTKDPVQSSMLVIDPASGEIRGLVGGREYTTQRGFNRAVDLKRQPGSTIKPIVDYAPALEAGYSPATVYNDVPTSFGSYSPTNYDGRYRGLISMRTAIMQSINIPAVQALNSIGTSSGLQFGQKLGLPLDSDYDNNLSLALGGIHEGLAPLHMAGAYATFANQGTYIEPHCITLIKDSAGTTVYEARPNHEVVMSPQTAYLITDMLISVTQGGTGTSAQMNRPVASKTGTTQLPDKKGFQNLKGNKDAWFAAYTPELVGVVWMGYDKDKDESGNLQYLKQIYGGKYPAGIWKKVMTVSLKNEAVSQFSKPTGLTTVRIDKKSGLLPSPYTPAEYIGSELFNTNNVPTEQSNIWQMMEVCPDSGKLATAFCPQKVNRARINLPRPSVAEDLDLYVPTTTCTVHAYGQSNTVTVFICTDSSHGNHEYLANIATSGTSGGCPASMVKTKTYLASAAPTTYCPLPEHAVAYSSSASNNNKNKSLSAPTNLRASLSDRDGRITINLSWNDKKNASNIIYMIEKTIDNNSTNKLSSYSKSMVDTQIEKGHAYQYRVYAYDNSTKVLSNGSNTVKINT